GGPNTGGVELGDGGWGWGGGGVGFWIGGGSCLASAARILVADPVEERREAARRFGATDLLDPSREDAAAREQELTGVGVDFAFDAVGRGAIVADGLRATRNGGTTVAVGAAPLDDVITIAPAALFTVTEKKLVGCTLGGCNSVREIPRFVSLWRAGRLDLEGLVTHRRPLEEINEAFDDLRASRGIRTVLAIGR
ncbi:MAG: zinc-binding dehydrogenase, partial [Alphaproteobacteria bacterium]